MSWYSRCSWCGGLFNGGNCRQCTNVSFGDEFVHNPDPISNDETPDFSYPPSPPQTSSFDQFHCFGCGDPLIEGRISDVHDRWDKLNESHNELFNMMQSFWEMVIQQKHATQEMSIQDIKDLKHQYLDEMKSMINQIQIEDYRNERTDIHYKRECEIKIDELKVNFNGMSIEINKKKEHRKLEQASNLSTYTTEPSRRFNSFCYDDDDYEKSTIPLNEIISQIPPSVAITPVLPTEEPEDSLIMRDEDLNTISEKESNEVIKSSVEDRVLILSESEDTSGSDSVYDLTSCDDFSPIDVPKGKSVTFSNPLFDSNDDFTSSDDESLSDEDVPKDNLKIYSNPLFEFDDEYISITPLPNVNEDECFDPSGDVDEIELLLQHDPSTPKMSVASILEGFTNEPPLKENDDLFDLESKENEWKKILYDAPIDDLMTEDKVFDLGIHKKIFSPTYVRLPFEDRHYLFFSYVIRIFLPYFTYPMDSPFLLPSESEDTIFDPGIFAFHLEPVASHRSGTFICFNFYLNILNESPMEICSSTHFNSNITMI
nr:hypothetical protein [Tanacetum cinerariifolium]